MQDPLRELYQRLKKPGLDSLERLHVEGDAWAAELAHQLCLAGMLAHFNVFNGCLASALKYGSGSLPVSAAEANLIKVCCLRVCSGCNERLIAKLKIRARFSKHADAIARASERIANVGALQAEDAKAFQELIVKLRDKELRATPTIMHGFLKPQKPPAEWKSAKRTWPVG